MPRLKRVLGLFETSTYGVGLILGAGIYALIGKAAGLTGNSVWLSFLIGAVISSFTGLSYAEFSSVFPKAGGSALYIKKSLDNDLFGFLVAWIMNFQNVFAGSTVALAFAGYFKGLFGLPVVATALILLFSLSLVNFSGIKRSSRLNTLFTLVEVSGLILIILLGIGSLGKVDYLEMANGLPGLFSSSALVFFAYLGFEDIVQVSEETKDSERTIPKTIITAIIICAILYALVGISSVSLANWKDLGASDAPLAYAASRVWGKKAFSILSAIALFATANTVLIFLVAGSRLLYGMANEGSLPRILSRVHPRRKTPWVSIFIVMALSMVFCFFGDIKLVADITNFGTFVAFACVNFSLIWLRFKEPKLKRPFRVPLNLGKFPLLAFLGLVSCLFMLLQFELSVVLVSVLIILIGFIFYRVYKPSKAKIGRKGI